MTRFDCGSLLNMGLVARMHLPLKSAVRKQVPGFKGVTLLPIWRRRSILSISLWEGVPALYGMGEVSAHVKAARFTAWRGIATSCGVFPYEGDWRNVLFGEGWSGPSPLTNL